MACTLPDCGCQQVKDCEYSSEIRLTDPKTGGQKGVKEERYELIPPSALRAVALVYGYGAKKYSEHNWAKGYPYSWSFGALCRHIFAFWRGEEIDPESKLPHLAHAVFHCFTLITFWEKGKGSDDRSGL